MDCLASLGVMFPLHHLLVSLTILVGICVVTTEAGLCWMVMGSSGLCRDLLDIGVTMDDCCQGGDVDRAWSPQTNLSGGILFYWQAFGGGAPQCQRCRGDPSVVVPERGADEDGQTWGVTYEDYESSELIKSLSFRDSCEGVHCGREKKCRMRHGQPRCVCAPDCSRQHMRHRGSVCGSDGRTYRNHCSMLKFNCRHNKNIQLNYYGKCKRSCEEVSCGVHKFCVADQYGLPHCVTCSMRCPPSATVDRPVCGTDGLTYPSLCHFREMSCRQGSGVTIAYLGPCQEGVTCSNLTCQPHQRCLVDPWTGRPQCSNCNTQSMCRYMETSTAGPICGTDNNTYPSWCKMLEASCSQGIVIKTSHNGACHQGPGGSMYDYYYASSGGSVE